MGKPKPKSEKTPWLKTKKKPGPRKKKEKKNFPQERKKASWMATQAIDWQCNNMVLVHYTEKGEIIQVQRVTTAAGVELIDNSD